MAHLLVLYSTTEGQTRKIAAYVTDALQERGHTVELAPSPDADEPFSIASYDGVILGASIHVGRHQKSVARFVRKHCDALSTRPSAFFSVSLAVLNTPQDDEAQAYVDAFLHETGWSPDVVDTVAGALRYTKYGFLKRFIMKQISKRNGRPTDTSRDFEFTDWAQMDRFVNRFVQLLESPEHWQNAPMHSPSTS